MQKPIQIVQVAFTYVGTVVGAGFATGQEILQFFTRYGAPAVITIAIASALFVWLGTKMMILGQEIGAKSYEDLNRHLFGKQLGGWFSLFTLFILFGITTVMLAGAGSVFQEHFHFSYQAGLLITLVLSFIVLSKGLHAIMTVNVIVVPLMLIFSALIFWITIDSPHAANWVLRTSDEPAGRIWLSPILYAAFNLATAQAVLVPLGAAIRDKAVLRMGGLLGGIMIGLMLLAAHFALSSQMPGITQFEIPMSHLLQKWGFVVQLLFILVIFGEIFTTYLADVYGLTLQLHNRTGWNRQLITCILLLLSYAISQIGFSTLLSTLYPLFGLVSVIWLAMMIWRRSAPGLR
ncbi:YkvI family membrane protein [Paenibacillus sp. y28]|uniref:YkvI family membrane protein n=1 Tax=Paenibacillus sp. y28 TaxID=3129110 RepID=UPI00301AF1F0